MQSTTQRRERFEQLIAAAERDIQHNPRRYTIKVALLALLGYAVIFGMLLVLIGLVGGLGWAALASTAFILFLFKTKLIFALLIMIYVLLRALWVRFQAPVGYRVKAKQYPAIFTELKSLSRKLKAPKVHQVILTPEYNAAIVQTPRLGVFGWYKNTLILGVELLLSQSPAQVRSVIAHELGHLSGKHSRFSGWIYRVRLSWDRIVNGLSQQNNFGTNLLRRFFNWYAPTFAAYSFALARANEYNADAVAAQLTSPEDIAHALINTHVVQGWVNEHYWQPFIRQADSIPQPPGSPYSQLLDFLQAATFDSHALQSKIDKAMAVKTGYYDTHPALKDRLAALKCPASPPERVSYSAAQAWFAGQLPDIMAHFDQQWRQQNESRWEERYHYMQEGRAKLAALQATPLAGMASEQLWQLAVLTEEFAPDQDCLALFERYKTQEPEQAKADFAIGRLLLAKQDAAGLDFIKQAMDKQEDLRLNGCDWLIYYYRELNDTAAVAYWQEQAERQYDINQAAQQERAFVANTDLLVSPGNHAEICQQIREQIHTLPGVKHAWLAEKPMRHYPEAKTYVLAFEKTLYSSEDALVKRLVAELEIEGLCFVVMKGGKSKVVAKQAIKEGVQLF
ncbi:M48 family metalloprotease [Methylovulum psychrotolerans]|uniref:M48 family metallopeptidase n=1 Tax=Methylovulum psychrotolerans TaxID=1704499 RepID=UPI001BFF3182|nr:M48 family metallopeptidase [Methylovulum psychrotolerans]MBT9099345.1 M48 family metalloprotease [Methylovulum psychrotolerans]